MPFHLKKALLGDQVREGDEVEQKHVLIDEQERCSLRREENKIVKDLRSRMNVLQGQLPFFDLRIEDGSYTVLIPDKANDPLYKNRGSGHGPTPEDSSHGRGATPEIATIRNTNPLYAIGTSLVRCFRGGCDPKIPKKEKVIMGGVNLYLEPSKMYLVL